MSKKKNNPIMIASGATEWTDKQWKEWSKATYDELHKNDPKPSDKKKPAKK